MYDICYLLSSYLFVICCIFVAYSVKLKDFHSSNLEADVCIGATPVKIIGIKIL